MDTFETLPIDNRQEIVVNEPKGGRYGSFKHRKPGSMDDIDVEMADGTIRTFEIRATPYTFYWAVMRFMFLNHDRRVYLDEFVEGVNETMAEFSPEKWAKWCYKDVVPAMKGGELVQQDAAPYQERLVTNARNLCRIGGKYPYGKRLVEIGCVMQYHTDNDSQGYFILLTSIDQKTLEKRRRGRKPRISVVVGA